MNVALIAQSEKSLAWALKRVFTSSGMSVRITQNVNEFSSCLQAKGSNKTVAVLNSQQVEDIQKWLWEAMRIKLKSLLPFIAFGHELEEQFLKRPENRVFEKRQKCHRYIQKPILLVKLLKTLKEIKPLPNDAELEADIKQYSNFSEGLLSCLHSELNPFSIFRAELEDFLRNFPKNKNNLIQAMNELENCISLVTSTRKYLPETIRNFDEIIKKDINKFAGFFEENSDIISILEQFSKIKREFENGEDFGEIIQKVSSSCYDFDLWCEDFFPEKAKLERKLRGINIDRGLR